MDQNKFPLITSPEIRFYCEEHTSSADESLKLLEEKSKEIENPKMISGEYLGRFLSMISKITQPKYILELGTFTGYGTMCLGEGLDHDGVIVTIEKNIALKGYYDNYIKNLNYTIVQKFGDALDIIPQLDYTFDLVFIDAAKRQYVKYFQLIIDKMKPGGIIIADNVLWKGKVVTDQVDKLGQGMMDFNAYIINDDRVENIVIPIDDGINLIRKK